MNTADLQLKVLQAVLKHGVQVQITRNGTAVDSKAQAAFYGEKENLSQSGGTGLNLVSEKKAVVSTAAVLQVSDQIIFGTEHYNIIRVSAHKYKEHQIAYTVELDYGT